MTTNLRRLPSPYEAEPVKHGTAEQLARLAHFRALDLPEATELDEIATFLIGDVGQALDRRDLWQRLQDDAEKLWHLITSDWDTDDLDEIPDADWERHDFATHEQELAHRYGVTRNRLVDGIEMTLRWERSATAHRREAERRRAHRQDVEAAVHRHPAGKALPFSEQPDGAA